MHKPQKAEPEPCPTCKGTGRADGFVHGADMVRYLPTVTDLASKQNDSGLKTQRPKGLRAAASGRQTQGLGSGG